MKFVSSLLAAAFVLGASTAHAGSDDGTPDHQALVQPATARAPAAAAAGTRKAEVYSDFEHQVAQP